MRFPVRVSTLLALVPVLALLFGAASARATTYGESESNDTTATADGPLFTGDSWTGAMQTDNDVDEYVLYVSSKTQVHLTLWNTTPPTSGDDCHDVAMELDDASGDYIVSPDDEGVCDGYNDAIDYTLDRGRYYLRLTKDEYDPFGGTYRIDVASAPALSPTDPTLIVTPPTDGGDPPPVSGGRKPARCSDPHLGGLTLRRAKARLAAHHCGVGTVHRRHTHRHQYVYAQSGTPGRHYHHGHRINLWLRPHHRHHH